MRITQDNVEEKFDILIEGGEGQEFVVQFMNPKYNPDSNAHEQFWRSDAIKDNCSASAMRSGIKDYFSSVWGSDISVTKIMYDYMMQETSDSSQAFTSKYEVTLLKRIMGPSYSGAAILQEMGGSVITLDLPWQQSSEPLQGNFVVTCPDENGNEFSTWELGYDHWVQGIDFHMQLQIPHLQFKIYVRNLFEYQYKENGVAFAVLFSGYEGDVPECRIESGTTTPLTGSNVVFETETIREYGQNLMFEPVPLSMLYTDAQ